LEGSGRARKITVIFDHFCRDFEDGLSISKELRSKQYPPGVLEKNSYLFSSVAAVLRGRLGDLTIESAVDLAA
jgi:hypothetical protein